MLNTNITPMLKVSHGGQDINVSDFYSTTYSTNHNALPRSIHTPHRYNDITSTQIQNLLCHSDNPTGYVRNVLPYVEYTKRIDEDDQFKIKNPFQTNSAFEFIDPRNIPIKAKKFLVGNSGFTRLPTKTLSSVPKLDNITTSGVNHSKDKFVYKDPNVKKREIIGSNSAYTSDVGHIEGFGLASSLNRFKKPDAVQQKPWSAYNYNFKLKRYEDGYSRSTFKDYMKVSGKHDSTEPTQCSHIVDPKVVIDNLFIKSASPNYKLGKKQQTGGVRSNEDHMNEICRDSTKRFNSETHDSTQDPILIRREQIASKGGYDAIKRSGYSLNSKYSKFLVGIKEPKYMHPTLVRYHNLVEREILQRKPTDAM